MEEVLNSPASLKIMRSLHDNGYGSHRSVASLASTCRSTWEMYLANKRELTRYKIPRDEIKYIDGRLLHPRMQPNGGHLVASLEYSEPGERGLIVVIDMRSNKKVRWFRSYERGLYDMCWSPCGRYIATVGGENFMRILDIEGSEPSRILRGIGEAAWSVSWSPCGKYILTGLHDQSILLWNFEDGEIIHRVDKRNDALICSVSFSPDGTCFAYSNESGDLCVYDTETFECIHNLHIPGYWATSISWHPSGEQLACGTLIWDLKPNCTRDIISDIDGWDVKVAWSPDGTMLACETSKDIIIFGENQKVFVRPKHTWWTFIGWEEDSSSILIVNRPNWTRGTSSIQRLVV